MLVNGAVPRTHVLRFSITVRECRLRPRGSRSSRGSCGSARSALSSPASCTSPRCVPQCLDLNKIKQIQRRTKYVYTFNSFWA